MGGKKGRRGAGEAGRRREEDSGTGRELETTWRMVGNVRRVQKGPVMNLERV